MLNYIATAVDRVDGKLDDLADTVRREYVPRVELDPRLRDLGDRVNNLESRRDADARERRNLRIGLAGLGLAGLSATTAVVALVAPHLN